MSETRRLLVSTVGTSEYEEVTYELDGRMTRTELSPVALANLLEIDAALILRTPEAGRNNDQLLTTGMDDAGVDLELADIHTITEQADVDEVLQTMTRRIREDGFEHQSVVLDISHSFRTIPLVFLIALMQLEALEEVSLERIYYSRFAGSREEDTSPVIDLTYLHTLMRWYDAFATAEQSGTFSPIQTLLEERSEEFFRDDDPRPRFGAAVSSLTGAQREIDAGFPLEAGIKTRDALRLLSGLDEEEFIGPEGIVLDPLEILLDGFQTTQEAGHKTELDLDEEELRRQAEIVGFYRDYGKYWIAVECARELFVNRLLYTEGRTENWLEKDVRKDMAPGGYRSGSTHDVSEVQELWDQLSQARNQYAHAGFKTKDRPADAKVDRWIRRLCSKIDDDDFWRS